VWASSLFVTYDWKGKVEDCSGRADPADLSRGARSIRRRKDGSYFIYIFYDRYIVGDKDERLVRVYLYGKSCSDLTGNFEHRTSKGPKLNFRCEPHIDNFVEFIVDAEFSKVSDIENIIEFKNGSSLIGSPQEGL